MKCTKHAHTTEGYNTAQLAMWREMPCTCNEPSPAMKWRRKYKIKHILIPEPIHTKLLQHKGDDTWEALLTRLLSYEA